MRSWSKTILDVDPELCLHLLAIAGSTAMCKRKQHSEHMIQLTHTKTLIPSGKGEVVQTFDILNRGGAMTQVFNIKTCSQHPNAL